MSLKHNIKINFNFPVFKFQDDLLTIAQQIIIPRIQEGFNRSFDIEGKKYERLERSTLRQKAKKGWRQEPLQATGKLRRSFITGRQRKNSVFITLNAERKQIGTYLQIDGIRSKRFGRRKFEFFGISRKSEKDAIIFMQTRIRKAINDGRSRFVKRIRG